MPAPDVYTHEVITVDPTAVYNEIWRALNEVGPLVVECLNRIVDVFNDLKLGWVGKTSDEVEAFNVEWKKAITGLFGSADDHTLGAFGQIGKAVFAAAWNYAQTEDNVTKMFTSFAQGLIDPKPDDGGGDPSRHRNEAPITENTP